MIVLELLLVGVAFFAVGRWTSQPLRGRLSSALKLWLTIRMVWLLSVWPVTQENGEVVPIWQVVIDTARAVDPQIFWTFLALAVGVKAIGIASSMYRWLLILRGQGIEFPFRHIFGTFLIGRAIGFFLPSTVGLDAYMLYDAARLSGRTVEVTAGKFLEKVIGFSGIFLSFLVALPFGIAIFGESGRIVALIAIPIASGVIIGLMCLLWFPGLVRWVLENVPIPAKRQLEGLVTRAASASAAYRGKRGLVVALFVLSFLVHFTTAAMYFFTAIAVGAGDKAEFWPIAFGSSIQIFATVIGPTIGGIGIREAVQYATLGGMLGAGPAILSASLGFLAAEAPTVFGFVIWLARSANYKPAYCRVDGEQVDYEVAAQAAVSLETEAERDQAGSGLGEAAPFGTRALTAAGHGFGGGVLGGLVLGIGEIFAIGSSGLGSEAQVWWYGPLLHAALFGGLGFLGGLALAVLPMDEEDARSWTPSLAFLASVVPLGLFITIFRLRRDVYAEQMPPLPVLLAVLAGFGVLALVLFLAGPRIFRGPLGRLTAPLPALGLLAATVVGGATAGRLFGPELPEAPVPAPLAANLAERPNVLLVMVDTLRADHLSCYGSTEVSTPNLCRLAANGGTIFEGFSHASWTKPATASLLTSLLPTSHGAMSKPSSLSEEITTVAEAFQQHGYATGGIVSNINLAESFGFHQGFDEYHYLGPDYLFGAQESSSKLILYQLGRTILFKFKKGLRFGDFYQDSEVVNEVAFDWFDRNQAARFFMFLHYMDPHDPYFEHPYSGVGIARAANQHPPADQAAEMARLYRGEIEYLDARFGELIAELERLGLYDDMVIALVSDHGEEFQEHGGWWHGTTLFEEQIHVPLLVKWAAGAPGARPDERDHVARLIDVAPTLLHQAGATVPETMQGVDLASDLAARNDRDRMHFAEEDHEGNVLRSIRTESWKLIEANAGNPRGLPEKALYDVSGDRAELENLYDQPGATETLPELKKHLEGQQKFAEAHQVGSGEAASISEEEEAALRALGYIE
ncbi:MAG: sulfatase-like hydrolase/transferase [Myxococcota bacterium]